MLDKREEFFINRNLYGYFNFNSDSKLHIDDDIGICVHCLSDIVPAYMYIIRKLKEAGLLPKNFWCTCCDCFLILKHCKRLNCDCGGSITFRSRRMQSNPFVAAVDGVNFYCNRCRKSIKNVKRSDL